MANLKMEFENAAKAVTNLKKKPDDSTLLRLYGLYKQSTVGDVTGLRPGLLDIKGRKKFDAWAALKGTASEEAMQGYTSLVNSLLNS